MSARDIMPALSHAGGHHEMRWGRLVAASTFREGEPVFVANSGEVTEFPVDGSAAVVADMDSGGIGGIAAMDGDTARTDGFARAAGDRISFYPFDDGTLFETRNFTTNGTEQAKTGALIGEALQIEANSGVWAVSTIAGTPGTDVVAHVVDVRDDDGQPVAAGATLTAGEGTIIFELRTS